jgi:hypothetical protein
MNYNFKNKTTDYILFDIIISIIIIMILSYK